MPCLVRHSRVTSFSKVHGGDMIGTIYSASMQAIHMYLRSDTYGLSVKSKAISWPFLKPYAQGYHLHLTDPTTGTGSSCDWSAINIL